MGKLKDAYNKIKPTDRQIKKQKKDNANNSKNNKMRDFLEKNGIILLLINVFIVYKKHMRVNLIIYKDMLRMKN